MKTVKMQGWEINSGIANRRYFDKPGVFTIGVVIRAQKLIGGRSVHFGIARVLIAFVAWYK